MRDPGWFGISLQCSSGGLSSSRKRMFFEKTIGVPGNSRVVENTIGFLKIDESVER